MGTFRFGMQATGLLLAVILVPQVANAEWTIGLRGGAMEQYLDASDMQAELNERGHAVTAAAEEDSSGGSIYGIYHFSENLGLEVAYHSLPASDFVVTGAVPDSQALADDMADIAAGQGDSVSIAIRPAYAITGPRWLFTPKLGIAVARNEVELVNGGQRFTSEKSKVGVLLGLGTQFRISHNFGLGLGWEQMRYSAQNGVSLLYADAELRFGR